MENQNLLLYGLQLTIIGMGVVFTALTLIIYVLKLTDRLTPWLVKLGGAGGHGHTHEHEEKVVAPTETPGVLSPEVMTAIAAAVVVAVGKRARIRRIRYRSVQPGSAWSVQGRASIMASHNVKR
jgi:Na+-transporting methylmalonyl-CoA/oxaloacetate decarboxylase gamma subunit